MEGVANQNGAHLFTGYQNNRGNWMEQMRGSLMVVATVIASLTFQIAINPPGGVWQENTDSSKGCGRKQNETCIAGTSVLAFGDNNQEAKYEIFILLCTISFSASLTIILLLISGFGNRFVVWLLRMVTGVSVLFLAGAYIISINMVLGPLGGPISNIIIGYGYFWGGLIVLLLLYFFCRFVIWLLKLCCCCCSKNASYT
ncbi:uncharacterized protein LOC131619924 [Vicia villosa]|uniref:uncharacterized protein LOC131619924 n=1 Tax=Vicia villosa TaxID=3911 RepID=UPI00273AE566|nr:uncharacterized protein LOC131619924 [Vicia villosa]